ncbi:MAG: hypothetical protein MJE77_09555 [Proteobacteria bacterium]|nr:hypothetical protein [Pseudomonadota bacterium]
MSPSDAAVVDTGPADTGSGQPALFKHRERSEKEALHALGAVPAWQAVVERGRYLSRRGRQGIIYGRLGGVVQPARPTIRDRGHHRESLPADYHWFIDETEGQGALAIRVAADGDISPGQRLVMWGAWHVDRERAWYWRAGRIEVLDSAEPTDLDHGPGDGPPGSHVIATINRPPRGARPVSEIERGPGDILFEVTRIATDPTSGWDISDPGTRRPVARLVLPGDRATYGAQDLRSPGEYWRLTRRVQYVVRIRRFKAPKPGTLAQMTALGPPRRIAVGARAGQ